MSTNLVAPAPTIMQSLAGRDLPTEHGVVETVRLAPIDNTQEYVTSGRFSTQVSKDTAEILATYADELLRFLGPKAYDRMESMDAEVAKCVRILKTYVLSDGLDVSPAVPEQDPLFASAKWVSDFVGRSVLEKLSMSIRDVFEQQLDAMKYGHKVAEITYEFNETGEDAGLYSLKHLKVLKQGSVAFARDKFKNVIGFKVPKLESGKKLRIIPREKFFVLTFRGVDADPRGTSILKAAYHAWHVKMMVWPEYILWLKQCAVPGLVGVTSAENDAKNYVRDSQGNFVKDANDNFIVIPATSQLADALQQLRNATAIAVPAGSTVTPINNQVSSEPFKTSVDLCNEEIEMSLLLQTLATSDSRHNTRAASQTAMTVLDVLIFDIKNIVLEAFRRDVVKQLLVVNQEKLVEVLNDLPENKANGFVITEEQVMKLVPKLALGDTERRLWGNEVDKITSGYSNGEGWIKESQLPSLYRQVGLPQATKEEHDQALAKKEAELKVLEVQGTPKPPTVTGAANG